MRADYLNILYSKSKTALEFRFDSLMAPPLYYYIHPYYVEELRKIATSSMRIKEKYKRIDDIMKPIGFKKFCAGTNRVVYFPYEDTNVLLKIAIDNVGMQDGPKEMYNQNLLKPFCTKVFDVSPCGTVSLVERFEPITSIEEFKYIAEDVFYILNDKIIGKYILQDIGTDYFMNWGIRRGFGPGLLDFPYVFNIDGKKLYCSKPLYPGYSYPVCGGEIDYDSGFNNLVCTKCGKIYTAEDLGMEKSCNSSERKGLIIIKGGDTMKVTLLNGDKIEAQSGNSTNVIPGFEEPTPKGSTGPIKVSLYEGDTLVAGSEIKTEKSEKKQYKEKGIPGMKPIKAVLSGPVQESNQDPVEDTEQVKVDSALNEEPMKENHDSSDANEIDNDETALENSDDEKSEESNTEGSDKNNDESDADEQDSTADNINTQSLFIPPYAEYDDEDDYNYSRKARRAAQYRSENKLNKHRKRLENENMKYY